MFKIYLWLWDYIAAVNFLYSNKNFVYCSSTHKVFHTNAFNSLLTTNTNNINNFNSINSNSAMVFNNNNIYKINHVNSHNNNNNNNNPFSFYSKSYIHKKHTNSNSIDFSLMGSMENVNNHAEHTGINGRNMINLKTNSISNGLNNSISNSINNNITPQTHNSSNLYFLDENFKISTKHKNTFQRTSVSEQSVAKPVITNSKDESPKMNGNPKNNLLNHHNSFRLPHVKPFDCKFCLK